MAKPSPNLFVSVVDETAYVKVVGRANFVSSVHFKTLLTELRERGFRAFILELKECATMDSTFLGVLAGLALKFGERSGHNSHLELVNPNDRIIELLDNLGVSHLFEMRKAERAELNGEEKPVDEVAPTRREISETCLEAHETLMTVNPDNVPKFKEVAQFLAEDLKRLKAEKTPQNS